MQDKVDAKRVDRGIPNHMVLSTERYMPVWVSKNPKLPIAKNETQTEIKPDTRW